MIVNSAVNGRESASSSKCLLKSTDGRLGKLVADRKTCLRRTVSIYRYFEICTHQTAVLLYIWLIFAVWRKCYLQLPETKLLHQLKCHVLYSMCAYTV